MIRFGSPTYAGDLAAVLFSKLIKQSNSGLARPELFHFSNDGRCAVGMISQKKF